MFIDDYLKGSKAEDFGIDRNTNSSKIQELINKVEKEAAEKGIGLMIKGHPKWNLEIFFYQLRDPHYEPDTS